MKKKLITTGIIGLSIVVLAVGLVQQVDAWPGCHKGFKGKADGPCHDAVKTMIHGNLGRLITLHATLDVTDRQREEIHTVIKAHREDILPAIEDIVASRRALRQSVLAEQYNEAAIRTAAADLGEAIANAAVLGAEVAAEVRPILTDEQIKQLQEFSLEHDDAVDECMDECASFNANAS